MNKYFEFVNSVKLVAGEKALENIAYELDFLGCSRPLILSDRGIEKIGMFGTITKILAGSGVDVSQSFLDIPPDSSTTVINNIVAFYRENLCDGIIALGGGSVIDTAKGARMALSQNKTDIMTLAGNEIIKKGKHIPFIVLPTTCGTGSECTSVAVIKNHETGTKMEFISSELLPDCAIIDIRLTKTLPPKLIASTSLDALCHSIEAFSSLQKNPISDAFAISAMRLITENLFTAVTNPTDDSRLALAVASTLAGVAFSNSMVGIVHAIGHACGGVSSVPHGNAMAILLPECMKFNLDKNKQVYAEMLCYLAGANTYASTPADHRAEKTIEFVTDFIQSFNKLGILPVNLSAFGVTKENIPNIAQKAINDGAIIVNNKMANLNDVTEILYKCL